MSGLHLPSLSAALVCALAAQTGPHDVFRHVEFTTSRAERPERRERLAGELEIDSLLWIDWDEDALLQSVARRLGYPPTGDSQARRIATLQASCEAFLAADSELFAAKRAWLAWQRARLAPTTPAAELQALEQAHLAHQERFASQAASGIQKILSLENERRGAPPLAGFREQANEAVLTGSYEALHDLNSRALTAEIADVTAALEARLADAFRVELTMEVKLSGANGDQGPIYLPGYSRGRADAPEPYPRFELLVDERTRDELRAAGELGRVLERALDGSISADFRLLLDELSVALRAALDGLDTELLTTLEAVIADLGASGDATLQPLIRELRRVEDLVRTLLAFELPDELGASDIERILALADLLSGRFTALRSTLEALPALLETTSSALLDLLEDLPAELRGETLEILVERFTRLRNELAVSAPLRRLVGDVQALLRSLGYNARLREAAGDIESVARPVLGAIDLDTVLDIQTAHGRHPGDRVVLLVRVTASSRSTGEEIVLDDRQRSFRLAVYGFYVETRGALLFADARANLNGNQNYEPVPGLGVNLHYGFANQRFLNEVLDPGFGLSFALLDFDDVHDLELGVGLNLTLFQDLLWVGYGYNLQVDADYFYAGINPLVLGELLRK